MKTELLMKSPLLALPLVALFLFLAVFLVMLVVTARRRPRTYDAVASLPLEPEVPPDAARHPDGAILTHEGDHR